MGMQLGYLVSLLLIVITSFDHLESFVLFSFQSLLTLHSKMG